MTTEDLQREFTRRAVERGGILMLAPADACALVERARRERIPVLGIDGFRLGSESTQPDLAHSIDFSSAPFRADPWSAAAAFLEERIQSGLHFEVVLAAPAA